MNGRKLSFVVALGLTLVVLTAWVLRADPPSCSPCSRGVTAAKPQATCPVMGGKIDKGVFVDVKGYRLYACCQGCLPKLKADPEKYVAKIKANGEVPVLLASLTCKGCGEAKGSAACKAGCAKAKAGRPTCRGCGAVKGTPACKVGCSLTKAQPTDAIPTVDTPALAVLLKSGAPGVILDARTGKWDDGRRVPGARTLSAKTTAEGAAALIKTKNTLVVTYCSGPKCPASHHLATRLRALGYTNILEYSHGIEGWAKAGLPIESSTH